MRIVFLSVFLLFVAAKSALADDVIYLKNGDKLSGTITTYTQNQVHLVSPYGTFNIRVTDIFGIHSNRVEIQENITIGDESSSDHLIGTAQPDVVTISDIDNAQSHLPPQNGQQEDLSKDKPGLWRAKWNGHANIGAELKTGNSENNGITVDVMLKAKWNKHTAIISADYNREEDDGDITVDNRSLGFEHDYFFRDEWFLGSKAKFEQDDIDLLDLRTTLSTGLGYQPYDREDLSLKFLIGPGYMKESFEDGSSESSATINWAIDYQQKFYDDLFRLYHKHDLNAPFDDFDAFLFQSESGIASPIRSGIVASAEVDFDWDNNPASGTVKDDTIYSLKLGYEW